MVKTVDQLKAVFFAALWWVKWGEVFASVYKIKWYLAESFEMLMFSGSVFADVYGVIGALTPCFMVIDCDKGGSRRD